MFVPSIPDLPRQSADPVLTSSSNRPFDIQLTIKIPFASVVYTSAGVHITYTMVIRDEQHDIAWQATNRYSAFRQLHNSIGKQFVNGKASFPSMMLTSKANRDKTEIELRRRRLETYMTVLFSSIFDSDQAVPFPRLVKLLKFIDYPYLDEWLNGGVTFQGIDVDIGSTSSDVQTKDGSERISALEQDTLRTTASPPPSMVTTRWRAPPVLPGPKLGLCLPYVSLAQDIDGTWDVIVRADRSTRKGFLRHRYDEAVAMCARTAQLEQVMDATNAQLFIMEFRKLHPVSMYLSYEKSLECNSPTSASKADRGSTHESGITETDADSATHVEDEVVGSPIVHHHRDFVADVAETAVTARQLFTSLRSLEDAPSSPPAPGKHYRLKSPRPGHSQASTTLSTTFVESVRGTRVTGCRCTRGSFCSTNEGDVYTTENGFAIVVRPPLNDSSEKD